MAPFRQEIRFARTSDGLRIAYAVSGRGYPLVRCTHWLTSIEYDWKTPVFGPWLREISARWHLYRYNGRGYGLSEGEGTPLSIETFVTDLEAVIEAAKLDRFALWGPSAGALPAIVYAARHPERVSHLVLTAALARGVLRRNPTPADTERFLAMAKLIELGWGQNHPGFLQMMTSQFFPNATLEQMRSFNELQRLTASPAQAARLVMAIGRRRRLVSARRRARPDVGHALSRRCARAARGSALDCCFDCKCPPGAGGFPKSSSAP